MVSVRYGVRVPDPLWMQEGEESTSRRAKTGP
jgi:hypothetical protein